MTSTSTCDLDQPCRRDTTATPARWLAAAGAALAVQFAAVVTGLGAYAIVLLAAFSTWGDSSSQTPAYIVLSIPVGIAAVMIYVGSGHLAARIAGDRRGWLLLAAGPLVWTATRFVIGAL